MRTLLDSSPRARNCKAHQRVQNPDITVRDVELVHQVLAIDLQRYTDGMHY